jgi:aminoglycoside phosphotransferase
VGLTVTNAELAKQLKKLNRLNLTELRALGDRAARACPNPTHLASALAKLNAE